MIWLRFVGIILMEIWLRLRTILNGFNYDNEWRLVISLKTGTCRIRIDSRNVYFIVSFVGDCHGMIHQFVSFVVNN